MLPEPLPPRLITSKTIWLLVKLNSARATPLEPGRIRRMIRKETGSLRMVYGKIRKLEKYFKMIKVSQKKLDRKRVLISRKQKTKPILK